MNHIVCILTAHADLPMHSMYVLPGRAMKSTKCLLGKILHSNGKTRDNFYNEISPYLIEVKT